MPDTLYAYGDLNFIWDDAKNTSNKVKHGISFETAALVFNDQYRIDFYDEENSLEEDRYNTIGLVGDILFVVYTEADTEDYECIRIISARPAEGCEIQAYNDNISGRF